MTSINSVYSDRTLEVTNHGAETKLVVNHIGEGRADIVVLRIDLLESLNAVERSTLDKAAAALAEAREQRDQARKAASDLKGVIDRSVVIDRADLPAVGLGNGVHVADGWAYVSSVGVKHARRRALAAVAVMEHVEAHPPVDQAQVEALVNAIRSDPDLDAAEDPYAAAERLVRQGWTKAEASR